MKTAEEIVACLKTASELSELDSQQHLKVDAVTICEQLIDSSFRIAVFAPFKYGKSTLLNALLGQQTLPIGIVPTTGAGIRIKYGKELTTVIRLKGRTIEEAGTKILEDFAVLDENRKMHRDVVSVEVLCPHPLLQKGIELLDLPGTNDMPEQDALVRDQLLKADLVIQILDARELFTLHERENLQQWLVERGINSVVFLVNYSNLLPSNHDRMAVYHRANTIATNFRSNIPSGISNLYRVDALPALRAKINENRIGLYRSGLLTLEVALYTFVSLRQQQVYSSRLPRVHAIATQITNILQVKADTYKKEIQVAEIRRNEEIQRGLERERILRQGFENSIRDLKDWLYLSSLRDRYQSDAASALRYGNFRNWETGAFQQARDQRVQAVERWIRQACQEFGGGYFSSLSLSFPADPTVYTPSKPDSLGFLKSIKNWLNSGQLEKERWNAYERKLDEAYRDAAYNYLNRFSENSSVLSNYESQVVPVIKFRIPPESSEIGYKRERVKVLDQNLKNLNTLSSNLTVESEDVNNEDIDFYGRLKKQVTVYLHFINLLIYPQKVRKPLKERIIKGGVVLILFVVTIGGWMYHQKSLETQKKPEQQHAILEKQPEVKLEPQRQVELERQNRLRKEAKTRATAFVKQLPSGPLRIITGAGVILRQEPRKEVRKGKRLQIGTIVSQLGETTKMGEYWYQVRDTTGKEGWVPGKFTKQLDRNGVGKTYIQLVQEKLNSHPNFGSLVGLCHFLSHAKNEVELENAVVLDRLRLTALQKSLEGSPSLEWINEQRANIRQDDSTGEWRVKEELFQK
ncbi:MAG: hypothetical protein BWK78_02345 [Thiotrichaceae bacterium IS1]|nr:MAG: hypothetical protein BWK78_02345 [Thiotrichaceae bacterium IS1]